jgi:hypothetical protein
MRARRTLGGPIASGGWSAREPGRRRLWPWVVLATLGAVAFVTDGIVGFLLGFIAALLLLDRAWPITGVLFDDAQHAYARLARERRLAAVGRRLKHRPAEEGQLPYLPDELEAGAERRTLAVQAIALDSIVGTTEPDKARAFDRRFRPPQWSRGRWQLLWIARSRGTPLPPISVYRVGDRHYVRDGHHRVSVARALGESTIDAEIVQLRPAPHLGRERREKTIPGA